MFVCPECGEGFGGGGFCPKDGVELKSSGGDPLLGQSVGSYRVARLLGEGGMGKVYKGVHPTIGSRVAIKLLSQDCSGNRELVERFFAEARAVNLIRHESIVNVLDLATLPDGRPYIVMEHLDGAPLSGVIAQRGPLPIGGFVRVILETLDALAAAHAKGIVHRDLKPDNIFVSPNGRAKVLDFGIAKLMPTMGEQAAGPTRAGSILGTPQYMSPEQALAQPVDARTDIYAIGVILFEGITGRPPFTAPSLFDLLRQHIEMPPPAPSLVRPDLPPPLEQVILRALAKDPNHRFQSAQEMAQALTHAASVLPADSWQNIGTASAGRAVVGPPSGGGWQVTPSPQPFAAAPHVASAPSLHPQMHRPRSRAGAIVAGVLGLAVVGGGVAMVAAKGSGSKHDPRTDLRHEATPPVIANSVTGPGTLTPPTAPPADTPARAFDPKKLDVHAFIDTAEAMAREEYPDAELVRIDAEGVFPDGHADLTLDDFSVLYRFQSPSKTREAKEGGGIKGVKKKGQDCIFYVNVTRDGISAYPVRDWDCDYVFVGRPRCTVKQVWEKAIKMGAPSSNAVADLGYWDDGRGKGRWNVTVGDEFSEWVIDSCK